MRIFRRFLNIKWHAIVVFLIAYNAEMNIYVFVYCINLAIKIKLMTKFLSWIVDDILPGLRGIFYPKINIENKSMKEKLVYNTYMRLYFYNL